MKKMLLISCLLLVGCGGNETREAPLKITSSTQANRLSGVRYSIVEITSLSNNLVIEDIKLNRGNCVIRKMMLTNGQIEELFPMKLTYGNSVKRTATCKKILEAQVVTSDGSWTFTWN
jgi:lipoprotein|nr:hypothetical protein [uncultured Campylobacter sp.]